MTPRDLLIDLLEEAFQRKSWHGTNLRGSVRGLTPELAAWRPAPGRHNVWEILVHAAYWKYAVRRRLTGEKRGSFALEGSNWFPRPIEGGGIEALKRDVALLVREHKALVAATRAIPEGMFERRAPKSAFTYAALVRGAAAHDVYHAGQIQVIKRLASQARGPRTPMP